MLSNCEELTFYQKLAGEVFLTIYVKYTICTTKGDEECSIEDIDVFAGELGADNKINFINNLSTNQMNDIEEKARVLVNYEYEKAKKEDNNRSLNKWRA